MKHLQEQIDKVAEQDRKIEEGHVKVDELKDWTEGPEKLCAEVW